MNQAAASKSRTICKAETIEDIVNCVPCSLFLVTSFTSSIVSNFYHYYYKKESTLVPFIQA